MALSHIFIPLILSLWLFWISVQVLHKIYHGIVTDPPGIPGPFWARFTRLWLLKETIQGTLHHTLIKLHAEHGPIVRIAPNQYSLDDPDSVSVVFGAGRGFNKGPWYDASGNPDSTHPTLFVERDPHKHAVFRRKVAATYSMSSVVKLEYFVDHCVSILTEKLHGFARTGERIDVSHWTQCFAFDVIGMITFGERFGFLNQGEDLWGIMHSLQSWLFYAARVGVYSEWHRLFFYVFRTFSNSTSGIAHVASFAKRRLNVFLHSSNPQLDKSAPMHFIARLLQVSEESPDKLGKGDIFAVCFANIGAGSDTTSIVMNTALHNIYKSPAVLERLRLELQNSGLCKGDPLSPLVPFQQAQRLPYLQAVIKESLRIHPPTGYPLTRVVPAGGASVAGHRIPSGAIVGISPWVTHHNVDVFGSNPSQFRPERWMECSAAMAKLRETYFLTFGSGSRTCIGKNISLLELYKTIPSIVMNFDLEVESETEKEPSTENVWFVKQKNMLCHVRRRELMGICANLGES